MHQGWPELNIITMYMPKHYRIKDFLLLTIVFLEANTAFWNKQQVLIDMYK